MAIMAGFTNPDTNGTLKTVKVGSDGALITNDNYSQRIAYTSGGLPEYVALAKAGSLDTAARWQIKKIAYSGSNAVSIEWASGTADFDKVWDDRATYTYS